MNLLLLPGDGIGTEIVAVIDRILDVYAKRDKLAINLERDLVGGCAYDAHGEPLSAATLEKAMNADAVMLGAVGGPKWEKLPWDKRPEAGLLMLRRELDLFANLRPARTFNALLHASAIKPELIDGLDILILRELTAGVYFGEPRGMQTWEGKERCIDTQAYTQPEIERIARVAFEMARLRSGQVHSADKANVMRTGVFWRETVSQVHQADYSDVKLAHMYADNCAMQLIRQPKQFDVIVTDNLFGDILSDEAAMLTGSLGMLPSASLGPEQGGKRRALYEPVHGSAPDIAGQGIANPCAMALSLAMAFRYSFKDEARATEIEAAVEGVLADGLRTPDLLGATDEAHATSGTLRKASTQDMIDAIAERIAA